MSQYRIFTYIQYKQHYIRTAKAQHQEGRFFPTDGYQAILNKLNKKQRLGKWMDIEIQAAFRGLYNIFVTHFQCFYTVYVFKCHS